MQKNRSTAFSLIELSIVVLIIGILIAGVVSGSKLYAKFKWQTAQTLTTSSPVNGIKNLVAWFETSLDASFDANKNFDGNTISNWRDINPQSAIKKSTYVVGAGGGGCSTCPTFVENGINGLPSLNFDGARTTRLIFSSSIEIGNSDYTIFLVEQRGSKSFNSSYGVPYLLATSAISIVYSNSSNSIIWRHDVNPTNMTYSDDTLLGATPVSHTFWLSQTNGGRKYWMNGGTTPSLQDATKNSPPPSEIQAGGYIGGATGGGNWYSGNISELIFFNRALTEEERMSVEKYLGQKYSINLRY